MIEIAASPTLMGSKPQNKESQGHQERNKVGVDFPHSHLISLEKRRLIEDLTLYICPQRHTRASVLFSKCTVDNMKMCFWGDFPVATTFSDDLVPY